VFFIKHILVSLKNACVVLRTAILNTMAVNFLKYLIPGNLGSVSEDISEKRPSLFGGHE